MAIYHLSAQVIGKGSGRSAVAAAAYRHCAQMERAETGEVIDYSRKGGNAHSEFALPEDAPKWALDLIEGKSVTDSSAAFWNRVEESEPRADGQLSREFVIALPEELSVEQNIDLVREFVASGFSAKGVVVDWAYHDIAGNPHAHIMTSLRPMNEVGFGGKRVSIVGEDGLVLRSDDGKIRYQQWSGGVAELRDLRQSWAEVQNLHLAKHGYDVRVDHRSFEELGIDAVPTKHRGPAADNIDERGERSELVANARIVARENYEKFVDDPLLVLKKLTVQKAVFTRQDIAREINRTECNAEEFQALFLHVSAHDELVPVAAPSFDPFTGEATSEPLFSTRSMVQLEHELLVNIETMKSKLFGGVPEHMMEAALSKFEADRGFALNDQQKAVVHALTRNGAAVAMVGYAGAGKSTSMHALRLAYEESGCRVVGGALAGIAAENLRDEAGIDSRTLASWEYQWAQGNLLPDDQTVFVMDEAGMVSSEQMSRVSTYLREAGAKMIVIGDAKQLQPIQAGAAFRAFVDVSGYSELNTVVRQSEKWMQDASIAFGRGDAKSGVNAYLDRDVVQWLPEPIEARAKLIDDWLGYHKARADVTIIAHTNRDVIALNHEARRALQATGGLTDGARFLTARGEKEFAVGDKIVFLQNNRDLKVFNGTTGEVVGVDARRPDRLEVLAEGHDLSLRLHSQDYNQIDYGYARTIHKEQGNTVDHAFVYATPTMDAQLSYVALSRHRNGVQLYAADNQFEKRADLGWIMSRDGVKDSTILHRETQDYKDVVRDFATRRGFPTTDAIREYITSNVSYLRERFDRVSEAFTKLREKLQLAPSLVRNTGDQARKAEKGKLRGQVPEGWSEPKQIDPPRISASLSQSLNRLEQKARPIEVGAVRRKGFSNRADYELNLASSAHELRDFNIAIREMVPQSQIMSQGIEKPEPHAPVLEGLNDTWKSYLTDNWGRVFAGQRAEQDHTMMQGFKEQVAENRIDRWYEQHLGKIRERFVPEKPFVPAAKVNPVVKPIEVRIVATAEMKDSQPAYPVKEAFGNIYRNPDQAFGALNQNYVEQGNSSRTIKALTSTPETFGELLGDVRIGFANKDRKGALDMAASIAPEVSGYFAFVEKAQQRLSPVIETQREAMQRPVEALSPAAEKFLDWASALENASTGPERTSQIQKLGEDVASINEIRQFQTSMASRYGRDPKDQIKGMQQDPALPDQSPTEHQARADKLLSVQKTFFNAMSLIRREQEKTRDQSLDRGLDKSRGVER